VPTKSVELRRLYKKRYYEKNRDRLNELSKARQKAHPERHLAYSRAWYARNREKERLRAEIKNRRVYGLPEPTRSRPDNCECCGKPNKFRVLALDHCHTTGTFRGWLCDACNLGLGKLGDTVEALQKAIDYLNRSKP
jgi:hypothetical protein